MGEVDRLRNGVVGVSLEGGLDADVPLRRHPVGGDEDLADILRDIFFVLEVVGCDQLLDKLGCKEAPLTGDFLEVRIDLKEVLAVEDVSDKDGGEDGLYP